MAHIAQTNLQLYNQLRRQGRSETELSDVRRAYELSCVLYTGFYAADRRPFVAHSVGVASVLAHLGLPAVLVATGLLHNVYGNGDFGDGRTNVATRARRRLVRNAVGEQVESRVHRFQQVRLRLDDGEDFASLIARLDSGDRQLLLVDLADYLDKYLDCSVLYHGEGRWISEPVARHGERLVGLARQLGQPKLATMLEEAFAHVAADPGIPAALRSSTDRKYGVLVVPPSCRRRGYPIAVGLWQGLMRRIRRRLFGVSR